MCVMSGHTSCSLCTGADILQLEMADAHCLATDRSSEPNGHEAMGPSARLPRSESSHAYHHSSLPLYELQLQRVGQYPQNHDGKLHALVYSMAHVHQSCA